MELSPLGNAMDRDVCLAADKFRLPRARADACRPWPLPDHVHLPYSIEEYCLTIPVKPHEERDDSVLIFAKRSSGFFTLHRTSGHS